MRKGAARWYLLGFALAACGCGRLASDGLSDPADATASEGSTAVDAAPDAGGVPDMCVEIAEATCEPIFRCEPLTGAALFPDQQQCVVEYAALCNARFAWPGTSYTKEALLACKRAAAGLSCFDYLMAYYSDAPHLSACDLPLGSAANGSPCFFDSSCASGYCGPDLAGYGTCNVCQDWLQPGHACSVGFLECAPGSQCREDPGAPGTNRCTQVARVGEACSADKPCWDSAPCTNGVCPMPALREQGAACTPGPATLHCLFDPQCNVDLYCESATNTCQPLPPLAQPGASCLETFCAAGAVCMGVCVAPAPWGSPCNDAGCVNPAVCIDGTCQLPNPALCE